MRGSFVPPLTCFRMQKLLKKKISQAAYVGFHPILSQDPKDFKAGTSVEGWTFNSKLLSCDFLCVFAKKCSKNRKNLPLQIVAMYNWSNLNITRHFEPSKTNIQLEESLAQIVASSSKYLFAKSPEKPHKKVQLQMLSSTLYTCRSLKIFWILS